MILKMIGVPSEANKLSVISSPLLDCSERLNPPGKNKFYHFGAGYMLKSFYIDKSKYDAVNPLAKNQFENFPKTMLTVGKLDEFGFQSADLKLVQKMKSAGMDISSIYHDENHSYIPIEQVGDFLK